MLGERSGTGPVGAWSAHLLLGILAATGGHGRADTSGAHSQDNPSNDQVPSSHTSMSTRPG
jgi:hypothetical protein